MKYKLGLTGSIGMGKSTTAGLFAELGCAVWDADAAVHRLYSRDGAAVAPVSEFLPTAIVYGEISRDVLKALISEDPNLLTRLERIVHPLVRKDREIFSNEEKADILVFDIPLLFETNSQSEFNAVATVYVEPKTQADRVLARGTMSENQFQMILAKQMPAWEKAEMADFVIHTDTLVHAREQVASIVKFIRGGLSHA